MGRSKDHAEQAIHRMASRQHGLATRAQLLGAGLTPSAVRHRIAVGRLIAVHRGVYRADSRPSPNAPEMAACLASGPEAMVGFLSAAALWGIVPASRRPDVVDIVLRTGNRRLRSGVRLRRLGGLRRDEVGYRDGIPVTTVERTVLDLCGARSRGSSTDAPEGLPSRELERALAEAISQRLTRIVDVRSMARRHPGSAAARLLEVLGDESGPAWTRSEAEERFLALVRRAGLPAPRVNGKLQGFEVDFVWDRVGLAVEVDGYVHHSSPRAFERDRRRDAALLAAGFRVMRLTWRQISDEPEVVLVQLGQAFAAVRHRPGRAPAQGSVAQEA